MNKPLVGVVVGSRSDFSLMQRALEQLRVMGIPYKFEVASPFKTPDRLAKFAQEAGDQGMEVIICAAGGSGSIAGMLAAYTTLPIIGVPIDSTQFRGEDSLMGMTQVPPGTPVATVGINNVENAAILAAQILALKYPRFREVLAYARQSARQRIERTYLELRESHPDLCDPIQTTATKVMSPGGDTDTDPAGSEAETPEGPVTKKIPPGSILVHNTSQRSAFAGTAGQLVETPIPQEPGTVTEDGELDEDLRRLSSARREDSPSPPPPADEDLNPISPSPSSHDTQDQDAMETVSSASLAQLMAEASSFDHNDNKTPAPNEIETKVFELDPTTPSEDVLDHAMMVLLEGGIVAFPTDTVYGLAVDATNPEAVRLLYQAKDQNPQHKSLSVLIHTPDQLDSLVKEVPPSIEKVIETFWPGGLTILFAKNSEVLQTVSDSPSIAIRIPDSPIPLQLMELIQRPLAVINASMNDSPAAIEADQVLRRFKKKIHCVLDAGTCSNGQASTVLSILTDPYEVLREGSVPTPELRKILADKLQG
jgi:5-(carboxyamino)imidazole ribonucleotide mutase